MKGQVRRNVGRSGLCEGKSLLSKAKPYAILLASIAAVIVFLHVLGPMWLETDALRPMAEFIEENEINANAYYYTEVEEFFQAERHMREYLGLAPGSER